MPDAPPAPSGPAAAAVATGAPPVGLAALSPVLVANRGEIAVRVMRTVRALGLASVAVHSDADAGAAHVRAADVAVRVGPAPARESYLVADALLDAARRVGARSVHPGYGFLSESAAFARAVGDAGLVWIGPPPEAIELMGDKGRAKALARESGVPVVAGLEAEGLGAEEVEAFVAEHGLPVVVKAVAGGGGKGMRVVRAADEVRGAVGAARREAEAGFGDGRLIVERWLERPRHVEVQVLCDAHGAAIHLGERECSLQRRHQKVVEEAPSPAVDERLRTELGEAATGLARACGYVGVGTVEFVVAGAEATGAQEAGARPEVAFLEMNTRLQVEHPVTELVHGVDLVEQQLRVAAGEPLALEQEDLATDGHAVEARLYAEDPAAGFLPAVGTVAALRAPAGPGVRLDLGLGAGDEVHTHYDPMVGKVVAHGADRATALGRLDRALAGLELLGITTSAAFTRALIARADVRAGAMDTGLLERVLPELALDRPDDLVPAAALAAFAGLTGGGPGAADESAAGGTSGWGAGLPAGWTSAGATLPWRHRYAGHGEVVVTGTPEAARVSVGEATWAASVLPERPPTSPAGDGAVLEAARGVRAGHVRVSLDGVSRRYALATSADGATTWIVRDGHHLELRTERLARTGGAAVAGSLQAPMPGTVLLVHVADGDRVGAGDVLLVLESMKMELQIAAPHDGVVSGAELAVGDRVTQGQALLAVEADVGGEDDHCGEDRT